MKSVKREASPRKAHVLLMLSVGAYCVVFGALVLLGRDSAYLGWTMTTLGAVSLWVAWSDWRVLNGKLPRIQYSVRTLLLVVTLVAVVLGTFASVRNLFGAGLPTPP
jgi:hypothetical protein